MLKEPKYLFELVNFRIIESCHKRSDMTSEKRKTQVITL